MRKRCQIARCADRPLRGNDRRDAFRQQAFQQLHRLPADARCAAPDGKQFQRQHQPRGIDVERFTNAAAMGEHQIALQLLGILRLDADARQLAEAGIDAIDRFIAIGCFTHQRRRRLDGGLRSIIELHGPALAPDCFQLFKPRFAGNENHRHS